MVADQPLLRAGTVRRVVDAWRANPDCIAAAAYNGKRGNPCLFPARFFPELCALEADRGGSSVIRRHEDALLLVEAGERELFDCDTKQALEILKEPCVVELYSDSKYVIDGLSKGWAKGWQKRGWIKSDKKPALNPDLWEQLLALTDIHEVRCHWVKGHAENEKNNRCDQMAVAESRKFQ